MITQAINLNLIPGQVLPRVNVSQYDSGTRTLQMTLFNGEQIFNVPSGASGFIQGTKPDRTGFQYAATVTAGSNIVTIDITQQMTAVKGEVVCELVLANDDDRIATVNFILYVEAAALADDTVISETDLPLIEEAAELAERIDGIVQQVDEDAQTASDAADKAEAYGTHPPYIGANGNWFVYNVTTQQYEDSGVKAQGPLSGLTDVALSTLTDAQSLIYDATSQKWVNGSVAYSSLSGKPTLGTAAAKDVPASGNASSAEVVLGSDTRLTDARTPVSHTHTKSEITDFPTLGTAAAKDSTNAVTQSSTDLVESGAVYTSEQNIYEVMGQNGAKNKEPFDIDVVKAKNTTGTWTGNSYELNGITFAFADDGKVTVSGTASALCSIAISRNYDLNGGYIITGCPSGGGSSTYSLRIYDSSATVVADDVGGGVSFTANNLTNCRTNIIVRKDAAISTPIVFAPMIRDSKDTDPTYQPFAETNKELTANKVSWEDFSDLGAVNKFYCTDATQESGGLNITRNTDDSFSISAGTTNAEINLPSSEAQAIEQAKLLTAGETYKFSIGVANANVKLQVLYKSSSTASWSSLVEGTNVSELIFTVPSDITSTGRIWTRFNIASGKTIPALTFYPMVTQLSYNGPYVPYAMTNRELTEEVTNIYDRKTPNVVADCNPPLIVGGSTFAINRFSSTSSNTPGGSGPLLTWSSSANYGAQIAFNDQGLFYRKNAGGTISAWRNLIS